MQVKIRSSIAWDFVCDAANLQKLSCTSLLAGLQFNEDLLAVVLISENGSGRS